jgi:hypothetical protein
LGSDRIIIRGSIEAIKLLHYKALGENNTQSEPSSAFSYLDSAEIVVFFDEEESKATGDVNSATLHRMYSILHSASGDNWLFS